SIKVPLRLSHAHAAVAEDPAETRRLAGTFSHESNDGARPALGCICFLRVSGDAVNGRVRSALTRDPARLFHFLSFVTQRSQRLVVSCPRFHVWLLGSKARTPLENLCVRNSSWSFIKHTT